MHYAKSLKDATLLEEWCNMSVVQFSNWARGGDRPKQATLRGTHDVYNHMALQCQGHHEHKPYQVTNQANCWKFNTANESEYQWLMCVRTCQALQQHFTAGFNLGAIQRPPVGHFQSIHLKP